MFKPTVIDDSLTKKLAKFPLHCVISGFVPTCRVEIQECYWCDRFSGGMAQLRHPFMHTPIHQSMLTLQGSHYLQVSTDHLSYFEPYLGLLACSF